MSPHGDVKDNNPQVQPQQDKQVAKNTTPSPPSKYKIHTACSLKEATALWWPLIRDLGWNRASADGPMHYHAARDGQSWLLVTPAGETQPQGCVVALPYSNKTAWIGFFLMNEAYRGQGAWCCVVARNGSDFSRCRDGGDWA